MSIYKKYYILFDGCIMRKYSPEELAYVYRKMVSPISKNMNYASMGQSIFIDVFSDLGYKQKTRFRE